MSELIRIEGVSKRYRLGVINRGMLYKDIQSWWARKTGREDPHEVVGKELNGNRKFQENGEFWALKDINLSIEQGDSIGIIGRNGAGKSTLLKVLSRTTAPTKGKIYTRGRISSLLEVGTGFHPELTGRENVYLNGAILGMSRKEVKSKFDEIVDFAEISEFIDTPVKRYSSGMYVRLAFAVAAHLDPEVLVVDEVLAVGDVRFQKKCLGKMQDATQHQGRTIIFVSHNMAAIQRLCRRAVVLNDGKVVADSTVAEGVKKYFQLCSVVNNSTPNIFFKNQKSHYDNTINVVSAAIRKEDGSESNDFSLDEKIFVSIKYHVRVETKKKIVPNFHFITSEGNCAFVTSPQNVVDCHLGLYEAKLSLPNNFLNSGSYSIDLAVTLYDLHNDTFSVPFYERGALMLSVSEAMFENDRYSFGGSIPGAVRPGLPWEISRIPE